MGEDDRRRIGLGCITRYIETPEPYQEFIRNVREHGHQVDALIIAMTRTADLAVLSELNDLIPIEVIEVGLDQELPSQAAAAGAREEDIERLIDTSTLEDYGMVPYCTQRNTILLQALLMDIDILIFFDHNMRPVELIGDSTTSSGRALRPVDFVGPHLEALSQGAAVSTGGYSGFDAFPPLQLAQLRDLLHGIGREDTYEVIQAEGSLAGLHLAPADPLGQRPAIQAFAGNLGLDLDQGHALPPFFSGWFRLGDDIVLARGEDTLLGAAAVSAQIGCVDVGTRVFLDPHNTFPQAPDLSKPKLLDRLYWNCLGWIARLPLLDHVRHEAGLLDWEPEELQGSRRLALGQSADALAEALGDNRFYDLPTFFDLSYMRLERTLGTYTSVRRAWQRVVAALRSEKR